MLDLYPEAAELVKPSAAERQARYYRLEIWPCPFGGFSLARALVRIVRTKHRRGYTRLIAAATVFLALSAASQAACISPSGTASAVIYNADFHVMQFCNGTAWAAMGTAGSSGGSCSSPSANAGAVIYNSDFHVMQFCNGTAWGAMGPVPGTGGSGCTGPSGTEGRMIYNSDYNTMQYCDGTKWRATGW